MAERGRRAASPLSTSSFLLFLWTPLRSFAGGIALGLIASGGIEVKLSRQLEVTMMNCEGGGGEEKVGKLFCVPFFCGSEVQCSSLNSNTDRPSELDTGKAKAVPGERCAPLTM